MMQAPACFKCMGRATVATSTYLPAGLVLVRRYCGACAPARPDLIPLNPTKE